jgi:hypothetical protein
MAVKKRQIPARSESKAPPVKTQKVRVMATRLGYYEHKRRRVGDVFVYAAPLDASGDAVLPSWVDEAPSASTPLKETGAQDALNQEQDAARRNLGAQPAATAASGDDLGI